MLTLPTSKSLWTPSDAAFTAWWDTRLPGGLIMGTEPGVRIIRDWSGNGHHLVQATAANQGALALLGPGSSMSVTLDNVDDGWVPSGNLGSGTDHTFVVGCNSLHVPSATHAGIGWWNLFIDITHYHVLGSATTTMVVQDPAGSHVSSATMLTGVHAYTWDINGATGKAWCYVDTTKAVAEVDCMANAPTTKCTLATTVVNFTPDASFYAAAYRNARCTTAELASVQAWAVRNNG